MTSPTSRRSRLARQRRTRRTRRLLIFVGTPLLVTAVGMLLSLLSVRALFFEQNTERVVGTVVTERTGIWNDLVVSYEFEGVSYRRTIPVIGSGLGDGATDSRHYADGSNVDLLVRRDKPGSVRTVTRWSPAFYEWVPAFGVACLVFLVGLAAEALHRRKARRKEGASDLAV
jgi:hypothetical protein